MSKQIKKIPEIEQLFSENLLSDVATYIEQAKLQASISVNSILLVRNWHIGRRIQQDILKAEKPEYGANIVEQLGKELTKHYGVGYSRSNMFNMVRCAGMLDFEKIQTLSGQFTWSHIIELLNIEDQIKRDFYIEMCRLERWSVRTLKNKVNSLTFERTAIAKQPEVVIKTELEKLKNADKLTPDLVFRDPYILNFLELESPYDEKTLENAIISDIEKFLLEFGTDFAFLARQKRITIDGEDYKMDLVMFHRRLRRIIVLELKRGKFTARDKGQIELYLKWLQKYETQEGENPPIGIVLCSEKSDAHVELLELEKSGIRVAQFLTELPPKKLLEDRLQRSITLAREKHFIKEVKE